MKRIDQGYFTSLENLEKKVKQVENHRTLIIDNKAKFQLQEAYNHL